jgi:hypothetical protein
LSLLSTAACIRSAVLALAAIDASIHGKSFARFPHSLFLFLF